MRYKEYKTVESNWISQIPSTWGFDEIKRHFHIIKEIAGEEGFEVISITQQGLKVKDITKNEGQMAQSYAKYQFVYPGDFAMNHMDLLTGYIGISSILGVTSPDYRVFRLDDKENCNPYYYLYLFQLCYKRAIFYGFGKGAASKGRWRMPASSFNSFLVPIPTKREQDQIVRYLDWKVSEINRIISNKKKQLKLIREYLDSEFRRITKTGCHRTKLKRFMALEQEYIEPEAEAEYRKAGMYNRGRGIFLRDSCPGKELGDSKFQRIRTGRLMLSGQFAWEDAVYITDIKDEEGIVSHRYYQLKPTGKVPVEYLFAYFLSDEGVLNLNLCSHGSAGRNRPLNIKEVLNLDIPIPKNNSEYNKIIKVVRSFMAYQLRIKDIENYLREYRTRLISDVVTGQIDVRDVIIPDYKSEADDDIAGDDADYDKMESEVSGDE